MLATVDTLVGSQELTRLLGVKRARVYQLSNTPDFPRPVAVLETGMDQAVPFLTTAKAVVRLDGDSIEVALARQLVAA